MKLTAVLFDLDGTLLPMDQDQFTKAYFKQLAHKLAQHGYDPSKLVDTIWAGTAAMVKNDGSCTNEEAFWKKFSGFWGEKVYEDIPVFDNFYRTDFSAVKEVCGYNPAAAKIIEMLKEKELRRILSTNPIFPAVATEARIRWAGLVPEDFELYTTYENASYCKPNPEYYREILKKQELSAEECLMVGNDVREDMIAEQLGMKVFLLTDCLINKDGKDISKYRRGSFAELEHYIGELLKES